MGESSLKLEKMCKLTPLSPPCKTSVSGSGVSSPALEHGLQSASKDFAFILTQLWRLPTLQPRVLHVMDFHRFGLLYTIFYVGCPLLVATDWILFSSQSLGCSSSTLSLSMSSLLPYNCEWIIPLLDSPSTCPLCSKGCGPPYLKHVWV